MQLSVLFGHTCKIRVTDLTALPFSSDAFLIFRRSSIVGSSLCLRGFLNRTKVCIAGQLLSFSTYLITLSLSLSFGRLLAGRFVAVDGVVVHRRSQTKDAPNKSLDASGGSVFRKIIGPAMLE